MQNRIPASPGLDPFGFVEEDVGDVGEGEEGVVVWLFGALALEEVGGAGREEEDYGEVWVGGERGDYIGDLNGCDGAGGCEEEVCFAVLGVGRCCEGGGGGGGGRGGEDGFHLKHCADAWYCGKEEEGDFAMVGVARLSRLIGHRSLADY